VFSALEFVSRVKTALTEPHGAEYRRRGECLHKSWVIGPPASCAPRSCSTAVPGCVRLPSPALAAATPRSCSWLGEAETMSRLSIALQKGRVSPAEYEELVRILMEHVFPSDKDRYTDFRQPYASLLWRAGILKRGPRSLGSVIALLAIYFAVCIALMGLERAGFGLPSGPSFGGVDAGSFGAMVAAFVLLRSFYNRFYKGEWLVDEAIGFVRWLVGIQWAFSLPLCLGVTVLGVHLREWVPFDMFVLGTVVVFQVVLWCFGRSPYKNLSYWGYWQP
jgi:hypothetical protein